MRCGGRQPLRLGEGWLDKGDWGGEGPLPLCAIPLPIAWNLEEITGILQTSSLSR